MTSNVFERFFIQQVHDMKVPKTTSLTPLQNGHGFSHKVITDLTLFGQIGPNSILNIFFVDIRKQMILIFVMYFTEF